MGIPNTFLLGFVEVWPATTFNINGQYGYVNSIRTILEMHF